MPVISTCPKCQQQVTVPDGIDADVQVRCPLCEQQYTLRDAIDSLPPALIPVELDFVAPAPSEEPAMAEPPPFPAFTPDAESPDAEGTAEPAEQPETSEGDYLFADSSGDESAEAAAPAAGEEPVLDIWKKVDDVPMIDSGGDDTAAAGAGAVDSSAFAAFSDDDDTGGEPQSVSAGLAKRRSRHKEKNMGAEMLKALIGGFVGLAVGYWGLNFFLGEQYNWFNVYLPFVKHTQNDWPFDGAAEEAQDPAEEGAGDGQTPDGGTAQAKAPTSPTPPTSSPSPDTASPATKTPEPPVVPPQPEPEPEPEPPATPPPGYVGPAWPMPAFDADVTGQALKSAHDAVTTGEGADTEVTDLGPDGYAAFCQLGQVLAFADDPSGSSRQDNQRVAAEELLRGLGQLPGGPDEIARRAAALLNDDVARQGGILLAGKVGKTMVDGDVQGMAIAVDGVLVNGLPKAAVVFANPHLDVQEGDQVVLIGSIINQPHDDFVGYRGDRAYVIWSAAAQVVGP